MTHMKLSENCLAKTFFALPGGTMPGCANPQGSHHSLLRICPSRLVLAHFKILISQICVTSLSLRIKAICLLTIDKIGVLAKSSFASSCVHETVRVELHRLG